MVCHLRENTDEDFWWQGAGRNIWIQMTGGWRELHDKEFHIFYLHQTVVSAWYHQKGLEKLETPVAVKSLVWLG